MSAKLFGIERELHGRVVRLAVPIILANISQPLLGAVDTAVMGHQDDSSYLAGLALGAMIFSFIYWAFGFLRMGTTGFAAQADGADDPRELGAALSRALLLGLILAGALLVLQGPIRSLAFFVLEGSEQALASAADYYAIRIWSAPATLMNYAILGWLIGLQRTRDALVIQVFLNSLNAALDIVLVESVGMGVGGVALGTTIAEYSALGVGLWLVLRQMRRRATVIDPRDVLDATGLGRLFSVNGDIFLRTLLLITAFALFTREGGRLGDQVLAANQVLMNFQLMLAFGLDGFAHAAEGLVGRSFGARDRDALRRMVRATSFWALATAVLVSLAYALAGGAIIALFTDLSAVRQTATDYLPWLVASPLLAVWCFQLDGIFIGAQRTGDMRNMMVISFAGYIAMLYPAIDAFGNHGLWASLMAFFVLRGVSLGLRYPALERAAGFYRG